jgi:hypothetical protein
MLKLGTSRITPKQANVLDILWTRCGDAQLFGLGTGGRWFLASNKYTANAWIELQSQSFPKEDFQRCSYDGHWTEKTERSCLPTLPITFGRWNESDSGEADDCSSDCIDNSFNIADRRRIRREEIEKEITRFQIGITACESIGNWQRDIWRRKGFRGEYHLFGWSQPIVLESPCVGYAPLESQIKLWAEESRIEGWFPHLAGEHNCCNVTGCAENKLPSDREQTRYAWFKLQTPRVSSHCIFNANQSVKLVAVDAGCKTKNVQRTGELRLDTPPHSRTNKRPFLFA